MPYHSRIFRTFTLLILVNVIPGTSGATGVAASTDFSAAQLSRIWREEFPVPSRPLPSIGVAPPMIDTSQAASRAAIGAAWQRQSDYPHPAVARIIVPEEGAISYGSGTLIDVREKFGMVITNWHVVRDATGTIEVVFPGGFSSKARALKVDADWDLAALVIWKPPVDPVSIAAAAPRPGDQLTICGYGQGSYRCATGRCTQYYAPRLDFPRHMVELDVEARQGDSGGPIFNSEGELAGVLFGAGQGTTLGSFGGRVGAFLATLAPDIGRAAESLAANNVPSPAGDMASLQTDRFAADTTAASALLRPHRGTGDRPPPQTTQSPSSLARLWPAKTDDSPSGAADDSRQASTTPLDTPAGTPLGSPWQSTDRDDLFEQMKTVLAAVGLLAIAVQVLRVAR